MVSFVSILKCSYEMPKVKHALKRTTLALLFLPKKASNQLTQCTFERNVFACKKQKQNIFLNLYTCLYLNTNASKQFISI